MLSKLVTKMAKNAFQNAQKKYKDKNKKIRAGKGTTQEKLDKLYEAGEAFQKKKKMILKNDAIAAKKVVRPKKKKLRTQSRAYWVILTQRKPTSTCGGGRLL